jgi:hypothetical protein
MKRFRAVPLLLDELSATAKIAMRESDIEVLGTQLKIKVSSAR